MAIPVDDGVSFDTAKLQVQPIREELEYGGSRLRTTAALAGARISIVVDIGFGDAIEPGAEDVHLPVLLEMPSPHLRAYPQETVIAEKLHAMVVLGLANSRMKDYYDVWMLQRGFKIDEARLQARDRRHLCAPPHRRTGHDARRLGRRLRRRPEQAGPMERLRPQPVGAGTNACRGGEGSAGLAGHRVQGPIKPAAAFDEVLTVQRSHPGSGRVFWALVRSNPGNSRCGCFSGGL